MKKMGGGITFLFGGWRGWVGREGGSKGLDERGLQFVTTLLFITYRCEYLLKIVHLIHLSVCKKKK